MFFVILFFFVDWNFGVWFGLRFEWLWSLRFLEECWFGMYDLVFLEVFVVVDVIFKKVFVSEEMVLG